MIHKKLDLKRKLCPRSTSVAMEVAIVFILSCFAVTSGSKCDLSAPLPKSAPLSYIKKITTWYQTVSSNDYISQQYICGTFASVKVTSESESFTALLKKYYSKAKPRPFKIYARKTTDEYFERLKVDYREIPALVSDEQGKWVLKAVEQDYPISINPEKYSLIGDGSRYVAFVQCTPQGWVVWILTPQKVLTTKELLYIHNELVRKGIHTELRLGNCEDIVPE